VGGKNDRPVRVQTAPVAPSVLANVVGAGERDQLAALSGWTSVASTMVSRPASRRPAAMECRTSKAALPAASSLTSSLTSPRQ